MLPLPFTVSDEKKNVFWKAHSKFVKVLDDVHASTGKEVHKPYKYSVFSGKPFNCINAFVICFWSWKSLNFFFQFCQLKIVNEIIFRMLFRVVQWFPKKMCRKDVTKKLVGVAWGQLFEVIDGHLICFQFGSLLLMSFYYLLEIASCLIIII